MAQTPTPPNQSSGAPARGIVAMLLAVACFALMDAVLKQLAQHYPPLQVAALRGLCGLPLVLAYLSWRRAWASVWRVRWGLHLLRGGLGMLMLALFTRGLADLTLSAAYSLFFVAPLLITALSVWVLRERVPPAHWWAIGLGFVGVLIALRPGGEALHSGFFSVGGWAILGAAACYAVVAIAGRLACRSDSSESLVLWMTVFSGAAATALAWPDWRAVAAEHTLLLLALAVTGFGGQVAITEAFRRAQASVVAPFEYTALAWGVGLDWLIWQTWPEAHTWLGAAIIVACGLYLVRHEQRIAPVHANAEHP